MSASDKERQRRTLAAAIGAAWCVSLLAAASATAQSGSSHPIDTDSYLEARFVEARLPGAALAITEGGQIVHSTARDLANSLIMQVQEGVFANQVLASAESIATMRTPPHDVDSPHAMDWAVLDPEASPLVAALFVLATSGAAASLDRDEGTAEANGITIAYERFGSPEDETILLIAGWGVQLTMWPESLIGRLVDEGYQVVRFDNRDAGLSTHLDDAGPPDWDAIVAALEAGETPPVAYTLEDMADDTIGLLDALEIEAAHIVGISMGGHIAQRFAIHHPERTLSLVSIASDTGNPEMPGMSEEVMQIPPPSADADRDAIIERELLVARTIGSPDFPTPEAEVRERAEADLDRAGPLDPIAGERQTAAMIVDGNRRELLGQLDVPTVVLHGDADRMVPVENARDTADSISDAELRIIEGLGHDIPEALIEEFASAILAAAQRSSGGGRE